MPLRFLPYFFPIIFLGQDLWAKPSSILIIEGAPQAHVAPKTGRYDGISFRLLDNLKKRGMPAGSVEVLPWKRIERMLEKNASFIVMGLARTPEREERFNWISSTYDEKFLMVSLKDKPVPIEDPVAMKSKRICRSFMTATAEMVKRLGLTNTSAVPNALACAKQLRGKRTDAWFSARRVILYNYRRAGYSLKELNFGPILYEYPIYVAASRTAPQEEIQRWRESIEAARSDGSLQTMQDDYEF